MTHILHVLDHSLPLLSGYSTRSHHELRAQIELGLQPLAVTSPKHGEATGREEIDGVTYVRTPAGSNGIAGKLPGSGELQLMQRLSVRLGEVAREHGSQVLHAHSPVLNGLPALWVGRRMGLPVVYEIRAFWEDAAVDHGTHRQGSLRYRTIRALETWVMRRADAVGVISQGLAAEVEARGIPAGKIFRIGNGVDTSRFRPLRRDAELTARWNLDGRTVIGFIGSFYRYEGLDILLQAWARVAGEFSDTVLLLVGSGETIEELRHGARQLRIEPRVVFAGPVPHAEAARCYSVCDVLVYPRQRMRLTDLVTPLKPLEAMAAGKAVIASDVGGLRELVRHGDTGLLFPAGDADALAEVLCAVVRNGDMREALGTAARSYVCREREWKQLVKVHVETYGKVMGR